MDHQNLCTSLSEAKTLQQCRLDERHIHTLIRVHQVVELAQLRGDVVQVPVARHDVVVQALQHAVQHPSCCCSLRVASQVLLRHNEHLVALRPSQVLHLLVDDARLVLVVELGARAVEAADADVVSSEAPDSQCSSQGGDVRQALEEALTPGVVGCLALLLGDLVNHVHSHLQVRRIRLRTLQLLNLFRFPAGNLLQLAVQLSFAVVEVKEHGRRDGRIGECVHLPRSGQDTTARGRDGSALFVCGGVG
mmetsp:Transcript_77967/g.170861  ORF Transcript_77967/g.170861 Transcript_77967/m.170861 type:complete len:249 (+) Transcript_77967:877-1623(+)